MSKRAWGEAGAKGGEWKVQYRQQLNIPSQTEMTQKKHIYLILYSIHLANGLKRFSTSLIFFYRLIFLYDGRTSFIVWYLDLLYNIYV